MKIRSCESMEQMQIGNQMKKVNLTYKAHYGVRKVLQNETINKKAKIRVYKTIIAPINTYPSQSYISSSQG